MKMLTIDMPLISMMMIEILGKRESFSWHIIIRNKINIMLIILTMIIMPYIVNRTITIMISVVLMIIMTRIVVQCTLYNDCTMHRTVAPRPAPPLLLPSSSASPSPWSRSLPLCLLVLLSLPLSLSLSLALPLSLPLSFLLSLPLSFPSD